MAKAAFPAEGQWIAMKRQRLAKKNMLCHG